MNLFKCLNDLSLFVNIFSNIDEMANFANKIICISDHELKKHFTKLLFGIDLSSL